MLTPPLVCPVMSLVHSLRLPDRSRAPSVLTQAARRGSPVGRTMSSSAPPATPSNGSALHAAGSGTSPYGYTVPTWAVPLPSGSPSHAASHSAAVHRRLPAATQAALATA